MLFSKGFKSVLSTLLTLDKYSSAVWYVAVKCRLNYLDRLFIDERRLSRLMSTHSDKSTIHNVLRTRL